PVRPNNEMQLTKRTEAGRVSQIGCRHLNSASQLISVFDRRAAAADIDTACGRRHGDTNESTLRFLRVRPSRARLANKRLPCADPERPFIFATQPVGVWVRLYGARASRRRRQEGT